MTKSVEIYFRDLIPEAQSRLLREFETSADEENWDVYPIAEIEREVDCSSISGQCQENLKCKRRRQNNFSRVKAWKPWVACGEAIARGGAELSNHREVLYFCRLNR